MNKCGVWRIGNENVFLCARLTNLPIALSLSVYISTYIFVHINRVNMIGARSWPHTRAC